MNVKGSLLPPYCLLGTTLLLDLPKLPRDLLLSRRLSLQSKDLQMALNTYPAILLTAILHLLKKYVLLKSTPGIQCDPRIQLPVNPPIAVLQN